MRRIAQAKLMKIKEVARMDVQINEVICLNLEHKKSDKIKIELHSFICK